MQDHFETVITAQDGSVKDNISLLWQYRDLMGLLVRRDFVLTYKQTILGPLWLILKPLLTSVVCSFIFGNLAGISTDGTPQLLFYMAGNALWGCFSSILNSTSITFVTNAGIFAKVFFPRLVMPISQSIISITNFFLQFAMYMILYLYFLLNGAQIHFSWYALLIPIALLQTTLLATGIGIIVSSFTTKYRDLSIAVSFGVQLWMYLSPVVYPLSIASGYYRIMLLINPLTMPLEIIRYGTLGIGTFNIYSFIGSILFAVVCMLYGMKRFSKIEKNFIDTI